MSKILVMDYNDTAKSLIDALRANGHEVYVAHNPEEALQIAASIPLDDVIAQEVTPASEFS